ncbi:MAG: nucleotidyltransferase domain-containing protein [Halobacteriales archaeon]
MPGPIDADRLAAARTVHRRLIEAEMAVDWALTCSTSFALQGVPVEPDDIDVQTDVAGATTIERVFVDSIMEPITWTRSEQLGSYLGALTLEGYTVEVIGALRKRRADGSWDRPVDVTDHREYVSIGSIDLPVLSLEYDANAYEWLDRTEQAQLLRDHS